MAASYDNGISILPANGYFAEVVDRLFKNVSLIVILLKRFNQNSMSKVKLVILATIIAWTGFESRQTATAVQFSAPTMTGTTHPHHVVTKVRSIALTKKCTIKRYRRPH